MKRRNELDIAKGLAILLVIIGHEPYVPNEAKQFIFAFHMPLFFILSGYFYSRGPISKDIKRLIIPYLFTGFLLLCYNIIDSLPAFDISMLKRDILRIYWGSGSMHYAPIAGDKPCIGAIWFLLALFWCKTTFGILERCISKNWLLGLNCVLISSASILLDRHCIYLPTSIFPGLAALVFFYAGYCFKDIKTLPWYITAGFIICFLIAALPFFKCPMLCMVNCRYGIYPISVLGGIGGTLMVVVLSKKISKVVFGKGLEWIGRLTLPILCFHLFQLNTSCLKPHVHIATTLWCALTFPILCTWVSTKVPLLIKIFGIKQA